MKYFLVLFFRLITFILIPFMVLGSKLADYLDDTLATLGVILLFSVLEFVYVVVAITLIIKFLGVAG